MFVLGTAGHVDHGKSTLLRQLTGLEPDRLPEEKRRGMTIDLGFVWMDTPFGRLGIIDVPGHRRFVRNMICGVTGIDAFLFVVAADDGWMPQSEEHLRVLAELRVQSGITVLSKIDLVSQTRREELVREVSDRLETALGRAVPVVSYSAATGEGLEAVRKSVLEELSRLSRPVDLAAPRMWIDRVFSPRGLGTVVTGTLREGKISRGDEVEILPSGKTALVKSLQCYHTAVREALPVSRVAVQLARISPSDLEKVTRGMLLHRGRKILLSARADARVVFFRPVSRRSVELSFHIGTHSQPALVIPLEDTRRAESIVRLKLRSPIPLRVADRFLLRTPGEEATVGAGIILDPVPDRKPHRERLETLLSFREGPNGWIEHGMRKSGYVELEHLIETSPYSVAELKTLLGGGAYRHIGPGLYLDPLKWDEAREFIRRRLTHHHQCFGQALAEGELVRDLGKALGLVAKPAEYLITSLVLAGDVRKEKNGYWHSSHRAGIDPGEDRRREKIRGVFQLAQGQPVSLRQLETAVREAKRSVWGMIQEGEIVALPEEHFLDSACYLAVKDRVRSFLGHRGQATTSELRIHLGTSRKNAVLVLEQMDRERVTFLKDGVRKLLQSLPFAEK